MTVLRDSLTGALAFVLGERCAGCDGPLGSMCEPCIASFSAVDAPATPRGLSVVSAVSYRDVAARGIRSLKAGRTSLARSFAPVLDGAIARADPTGTVAIVPMPTSARSYRKRGFRVPETLLRAAHVPAYRALATRGRPLDQRGLSMEERAINVAGSMRMRRGVAAPQTALVFDDVYTTGATLDEAARVLTSYGCQVVGAVTLAHTPRR